MAYTPKTWACGDTITAEELNRMEEGISSASGGDGIFTFTITSPSYQTWTCDKSYDDIADALDAYKIVIGTALEGSNFATFDNSYNITLNPVNSTGIYTISNDNTVTRSTNEQD